jgi:transcriptional regulator with XRE-family HTH domain
MGNRTGQLFRYISTTLVLVRELLGRVKQAECARRAGVTRSQLSRYETEGAVPTLEPLGRVLGALEVGPGEFFTVMAAVDLLAGGEESLESIRRTVLERQRSVLDEFLAGIARRREGAAPIKRQGTIREGASE